MQTIPIIKFSIRFVAVHKLICYNEFEKIFRNCLKYNFKFVYKVG